MKRPDEGGALVQFRLDDAGDAKVAELDAPCLGHQDVGALDISVDDALFVHPENGFCQLSHNRDDPFFLESSWRGGFHQSGHASSSTIFRHHPHSLANGEHVES